MKALLHWLKMVFHVHEWGVTEVHTVRRFEDDYAKRPIETRRIYIRQCKMCGKMRKTTIKI